MLYIWHIAPAIGALLLLANGQQFTLGVTAKFNNGKVFVKKMMLDDTCTSELGSMEDVANKIAERFQQRFASLYQEEVGVETITTTIATTTATESVTSKSTQASSSETKNVTPSTPNQTEGKETTSMILTQETTNEDAATKSSSVLHTETTPTGHRVDSNVDSMTTDTTVPETKTDGAGMYGWTQVMGTQYSYKLYTEKKNYLEAKLACEKEKSRLISKGVQDAHLKFFITKMSKIFNITRFWLGLDDSEEEALWRWSDGSAGEIDWAKNEPDDWRNSQQEDCAVFRFEYGNWKAVDVQCSQQHIFICERDNDAGDSQNPVGTDPAVTCDVLHRNTCFWIVEGDAYLNYSQAESACREKSSKPAYIYDKANYDLLTSRAFGTNTDLRTVWTGIRYDPKTNEAKNSDGTDAPFVEWCCASPSRGTGNHYRTYVYLSGKNGSFGMVNSDQKTQANAVICQTQDNV